MNTAKYSRYSLNEAIALFKEAENSVCPTEYYSCLADLLEKEGASLDKVESAEGVNFTPFAKKLNTLLTKSYTVIAREGTELYGLASMDKQGNLGLLYVKGDSAKKTAKLLIRALERPAAEKEIAEINAVPEESAAKIFIECDYAPKAEAGKSLEGFGGVPLFKSIKPEKEPVDFPPECAKKIVLDGRKPIREERGDGIFPYLFFGMACFFVLLLIFIIIVNKGNIDEEALILFGVMVGVIFIIASAIMAVHCVRLHRFKMRVLAGSVTNGVITDISYDEYRVHSGSDDDGKKIINVYFSYAYYDGQLNLRTGSFKSKYKNKAPLFYRGQEVIVAYSFGRSCVLSKYTILEEAGGRVLPPVEESVEEEDDIILSQVSEEDKKLKLSGKPKDIDDPSAYVPVAARKRFFAGGLAVLGMLAVLWCVMLFFNILAARQTFTPLYKQVVNVLPFTAPVTVVLGAICAMSLVPAVSAKRKYKKMLGTEVTFVAGKIICGDKTYKSDNKNRFYCAYKNARGEVCKISLSGQSVFDLVRYGATDALVAYNGSGAVVLVDNRKSF